MPKHLSQQIADFGVRTKKGSKSSAIESPTRGFEEDMTWKGMKGWFLKEQKTEYLELVPDHSMENDHVEIIENVR